MDPEPEKKTHLPKRIKGKHSQTFQDYKIEANYFSVKVPVNIEQICVYKVVFNPNIPFDNTKQRMSLLEQGKPDIKAFIPSPVFSGSNIYSLRDPSLNEKQIRVSNYTIKIKLVKVLKVSENPKILLMFLNKALKNMFSKIGYTEIGNTGKFFEVKNAQNIDQELKMFSGFKANFMSLDRGMLYLRVDSAKKIVRNSTVLDYINQVYNKNKNKERDEKRAILKEEVIGKIIMTNYGKTRYLKIKDVIFENVDEVKLNGTDTTLRQFYETKYSKKIQNGKQPLIQVESKQKEGNRTILVPEMCLMTGIPQDFDEFKRKKISEATIRDPSQKKRDIEEFMRKAESVNDLTSLKELGIDIDKKLAQLTAKLVSNPKLELGNGRSVDRGKQSGFQLFRDSLYDTKNSLKCGIFFTDSDLSQFTSTLSSTAKSLGVNFSYEKYQIKQRDKHRIIKGFFMEIENAIKRENINMALIIIPIFLKNSYGQIKRECLRNLNIVSQCVLDKSLRKNGPAVPTKVLLQMIAKRGNTLWVPRITGKIFDTMIMAYDTSKGFAGHSISCCGTINDSFTSIYTRTSKFTQLQDKFTAMVKLFMQQINFYAKKNSRNPKEVIIFCNSCTGDQMRLFHNFFLDSLLSKLRDSCGNSAPNITLVMVNTKTSERFFQGSGEARNVKAGTIVSENIVSENYDFYLVSQSSNRGSSVPNHYKVVFTNSNIQEGILYELIYSQCFNYVNWTGSIKVPGILQYAKKSAKFSAEALQGNNVREDLENKLYFV